LGFSFPLGIPLLLHPLLLVVITIGRGKNWVYVVHAIYFGVVAVFLWTAVSRSQYEKSRVRVPELTRANWMLNWLLFFVIFPSLLWVFFGLKNLLR
jgi:hypothetical protein